MIGEGDFGLLTRWFREVSCTLSRFPRIALLWLASFSRFIGEPRITNFHTVNLACWHCLAQSDSKFEHRLIHDYIFMNWNKVAHFSLHFKASTVILYLHMYLFSFSSKEFFKTRVKNICIMTLIIKIYYFFNFLNRTIIFLTDIFLTLTGVRTFFSPSLKPLKAQKC